jgi:excisionase family DNA binding protein
MTNHNDPPQAGRPGQTVNPATSRCAEQDLAPKGRHPGSSDCPFSDQVGSQGSAELSRSRSAGATWLATAIELMEEANTVAAAEAPVFHTVEAVAKALHTSTKTIRRRIKEGVIRKVPMGGRLVRISSEELRRLGCEVSMSSQILGKD